MAEVVWRPQALRDLEAIEAYYEEVAPDFAPLFVAGTFEAIGWLADFPELGRIVPEIEDESILESGYHQCWIVYVVTGDTAEILTVYHSMHRFGGPR